MQRSKGKRQFMPARIFSKRVEINIMRTLLVETTDAQCCAGPNYSLQQQLENAVGLQGFLAACKPRLQQGSSLY